MTFSRVFNRLAGSTAMLKSIAIPLQGQRSRIFPVTLMRYYHNNPPMTIGVQNVEFIRLKESIEYWTIKTKKETKEVSPTLHYLADQLLTGIKNCKCENELIEMIKSHPEAIFKWHNDEAAQYELVRNLKIMSTNEILKVAGAEENRVRPKA